MKLDFNATVSNFDKWSWRPALKIYDQVKKVWLPYRADIFAFGDDEDKIVYDYNTNLDINYGQEEYDPMQSWHYFDMYYANPETTSTDNCSMAFKIARDAYDDFDNLISFSGGSASISLLGIVYVIPGTFENGQWDIVYEENFDNPNKGRMEINSSVIHSHSYMREFEITDIIKKNIKLSGAPFDAPDVDNRWVDLSITGINLDNIARIVNVYGIVNRIDKPLIISFLEDPTPGFSVTDDFWIFNRTHPVAVLVCIHGIKWMTERKSNPLS